MATKTAAVEVVEITSYLSHLEEGKMRAEDDGTFTVVSNFDGFSRDPSPTPEAIRERMLAGDPPTQVKHTFVAGETGYELVRVNDGGAKRHSDGSAVVDEFGQPISAGRFAIWSRKA